MNAEERFKVFDAERKRKAAAARAKEQTEREALATIIPEMERPEVILSGSVADCVKEVDELPEDVWGGMIDSHGMPSMKGRTDYMVRRANSIKRGRRRTYRGKGGRRIE